MIAPATPSAVTAEMVEVGARYQSAKDYGHERYWPHYEASTRSFLEAALAVRAPPTEQPSALKVREGGYYRAQTTGLKIGPMFQIPGDSLRVWYQRDGKGDWSGDGKGLHGAPDLVAEWDVPPASGEALREALAAERERCAKVADAQVESDKTLRDKGEVSVEGAGLCILTGRLIAKDIRALSDAPR